MARKRFASSARAKQAAKSGKHTPSSRIDFSDIPESTDAELRRGWGLWSLREKEKAPFSG